MYERAHLTNPLFDKLVSPVYLLQVVVGPRQVGKTFAIEQICKRWPAKTFYHSADQVAPPDAFWLHAKWEAARKVALLEKDVLLVLDEVQKIPRWSEVVKKMFDEDRKAQVPLRVVILGSSALLVQKGLTESLAGRFELTRFSHWSYLECHECFQWELDTYLFYGGYPGAAKLVLNEDRWGAYVRDSLIETVLSKDIFLLNTIDKPALFRQVFSLACEHPAEIMTYQKMLGQLQEAGNTTTISSYLDLLKSAFLIAPIPRWSGSRVRRRASSPKIVVQNNALINALLFRKFQSTLNDSDLWGRLIENAIGAKLVQLDVEVYYWRERDFEIDYVIKRGTQLLAIEIKKGSIASSDLVPLKHFLKSYPNAKSLIIGGLGADCSIEDFFKSDIKEYF